MDNQYTGYYIFGYNGKSGFGGIRGYGQNNESQILMIISDKKNHLVSDIDFGTEYLLSLDDVKSMHKQLGAFISKIDDTV